MLKLKNSAMLVVAGLCGYLALMTPDWKSELSAMSGVGYLPNNDYNMTVSSKTSDVLMRSTSTGTWTLFDIQNSQVVTSSNPAINTSSDYVYQGTLAVGDGTGDVQVLTRRTSTGAWIASRIHLGSVIATNSLGGLYLNALWQRSAIGDFNGDGKDDIILRNTSTGQYVSFMFNNGVVASSAVYNGYLTADLAPVAAPDLDADGDDDVVVRSASTGYYYVYITQNGVVTGYKMLDTLWSNAAWSFQFSSDMNNDGFDDVILRDASGTGNWQQFIFGAPTPTNRFVVVNSRFLNLWHNVPDIIYGAAGDYNGDGFSDVILYDTRGYWWSTPTDSSGLSNVSIGTSTINLFGNADWTIQQWGG